MSKGKHAAPSPRRAGSYRSRARRRWPWVLVAVLLVLGLAAGGTAYAAYRYDQRMRDRILGGVRVAGIDVGGMTQDEALAAVGAHFDRIFGSQTTVKAGDMKWTISPADMGAEAPYEEAVDKALALSSGYSWTQRVWRRLNDRPENVAFEALVAMDGEEVRAFVAKVSGAVGIAPTNGGLRLKGNELEFVKSRSGRELVASEALIAVRESLREQRGSVKLSMQHIAPKDKGTDTTTLVVDLSQNRLYVYDGKKIDRKYDVATGAPGFPTPDGSFSIVEKRKNPTWTNPDPTGWGASMPDEIAPGPGNPLGTRALNLNAPGIRIHGTSDIASLGTAASHGCIRMAMPDVESLYRHVDVGTAVLIKK